MNQAPQFGIRSGQQTASKALIWAAVIHLLPGLLYWPVGGIKFDLNDCVRIGGFLFLAAMGVWARRSPLPPAALCFSLYMVFLALQASQGLIWRPVLWVVQGPVVLLLLTALIAAAKDRAARRVTVDRANRGAAD